MTDKKKTGGEIINSYSPYLLSNYLGNKSKILKQCEPKEGTYRIKGKTLTGWFLPTSTKHDVFCFDHASREILCGG